jgi:hypothetical protein
MKKWCDGTASGSNNVSHVNGNMNGNLNGIVNIHGVVVMPTGQPSSVCGAAAVSPEHVNSPGLC